MSTQACSTCKWWQSFEDWWGEWGQYYYDELRDVDDWGKEPHKRRWGQCMIARTSGGKLKNPQSKAGAYDLGDCYYAELLTAPDFYCNQWEST